MSQISPDNHRDGALIAEWISLVGRQRVEAVAVHFGMAPHYAKRCLRAALLDGLLGKVRTGPTFLWMLPADEKVFREAMRKSRDAGRSAYSLALYHRRRKAGEIDSRGQLLDPEHWPVVQRVVPAAGARPIVTRAPNSVFALGAAA